jgi:predicted O-linked N-acetylglucosamine transferase (SPINDLY family)
MRASALTDEPQFARDMEDAYRRMWRTWCAGAAQG